MSTDFWASYISGALGICIGNRLDIWKTELQAGNRNFRSSSFSAAAAAAAATAASTATTITAPATIQNQIVFAPNHAGALAVPAAGSPQRFQNLISLFRGAAAPILGYGALNSILFMTYNRTLGLLDPSIPDYTKLAGVDLGKIWIAGAAGGLACWVVSAPSELIKCRAQLMVDGHGSSYGVFVDTWRRSGLRGLYLGGTITSIRDSVGYGWYFWTYELSKRLLLSRQPDPFAEPQATDVLLAGGIAGVVTWVSIYPLDVVKTRLQTQSASLETNSLLRSEGISVNSRTSWSITRDIFRAEGVVGFYRGLAICSLRAFIVNAAQWYIYEKTTQLLSMEAT